MPFIKLPQEARQAWAAAEVALPLSQNSSQHDLVSIGQTDLQDIRISQENFEPTTLSLPPNHRNSPVSRGKYLQQHHEFFNNCLVEATLDFSMLSVPDKSFTAVGERILKALPEGILFDGFGRGASTVALATSMTAENIRPVIDGLPNTLTIGTWDNGSLFNRKVLEGILRKSIIYPRKLDNLPSALEYLRRLDKKRDTLKDIYFSGRYALLEFGGTMVFAQRDKKYEFLRDKKTGKLATRKKQIENIKGCVSAIILPYHPEVSYRDNLQTDGGIGNAQTYEVISIEDFREKLSRTRN